AHGRQASEAPGAVTDLPGEGRPHRPLGDGVGVVEHEHGVGVAHRPHIGLMAADVQRRDRDTVSEVPAVFTVLLVAESRKEDAEVVEQAIEGGGLDLVQYDLDSLARLRRMAGDDSRSASPLPIDACHDVGYTVIPGE